MTKKTLPIAAQVAHHEALSYPMEELVSSGLLWLINSTVFWPRGFALALEDERVPGQTGPDAHKIAGFLILGDGSEPIISSEEEISQRRFEAVEDLFAKLRHEGVQARLKGTAL